MASRQPLHVVEAPEPASKPAQPTRLQLSRKLASALAKEDRARAALAKAQAEVEAAFMPWAAGRSISRDQARAQLASTGHLPQRKLRE